MSNVYVYEEGNNYYGEVITQPNVAIIYIMQRSSGFDNVIDQDTSKNLFREEHRKSGTTILQQQQIKHLRSIDRKIRIVMPKGGGGCANRNIQLAGGVL